VIVAIVSVTETAATPEMSGGKVSTDAVVTDAATDGSDSFPAASKASTRYWYVVEGVRPVSRYDEVPVVATGVPLLNTRYPITPVSSVLGAQLRSIVVGVTADAVRKAGVDGAVVSTDALSSIALAISAGPSARAYTRTSSRNP
jgi:hypothetical protein